MAKKVTGKPSVATLTKSEKTEQGNTVVHPPEYETVEAPKPVAVPCVVAVNAGQTIPVGDYANVKIGVHLSVTCEPDEVEDTFDFISSWVGEKLSEMSDGVHQSFQGD